MKIRFLRAMARDFAILAVLALFFLYGTPAMRNVRCLPNMVHLQEDETMTSYLEASIPSLFPAEQNSVMTVSSQQAQTLSSVSTQSVTLRLFGLIPVKTVSVDSQPRRKLIPGGDSIGVMLYTKGALVVGTGSVLTEQGPQCPASAAGIRAGDILLRVNGIDVQNASHLADLCNNSGMALALTVQRDGKLFETTLVPALNVSDHLYRMGMWVRDSTAGIGTLSFCDPQANWYAALGHAVTDIDTRQNLTVRNGSIVASRIEDVVQGEQGAPGELRGSFDLSDEAFGSILVNTDFGIFGELYQAYRNERYPDGLWMAYPEEVHTGAAQILTTIDGTGVQAYDCEILRVAEQGTAASRSMVIQVTDPDLLHTTGGIVQGMSGSPIIQDNKLVGAVTHVFVNDPTRGYCIYALWMSDMIPYSN